MGHTDEGIVLTDGEREALARLAESIGDPWLARQLAGQDAAGQKPRRRRPPSLRAPAIRALSASVGPALLIAGGVLALATFVRSTALATLALVMMGVGLWRLAQGHGERVARWVASRRAGPRPATAATPPPPPRTPPAAE